MQFDDLMIWKLKYESGIKRGENGSRKVRKA